MFWVCTGILTGVAVALTSGKGCKDIPVILATVVGTVCNIRVALVVFAVVVITCDTVLRFDKDVTV